MDVICSALAGVMARAVCHPLDTAKTVTFTGFFGDSSSSLHVNSKGSLRHVASSIWRREGPGAFYRGAGVAIVGSAPGTALYLTTYTWSRDFLQGYVSASHSSSFLSTIPSSFIHLICGLFAESVSCIFWVPIDVTKERLQAQSSFVEGRYKGNWDAIRTVARYEGVRGLYKGYWSTLASFGPYSAVYFGCYEVFENVLNEHMSLGTFSSSLCAGGMGNIVACVVTNPLELVKTRLQVQRAVLSVNGKPTAVYGFPFRYKGLLDGLCAIVKSEGVCALWKGLPIRVTFAAPNAALTMGFYSYLKGNMA
ncbi:mitochondrial carrier protein, putative [Trypanosoma brucei brucei TREU927]|uniref:Mitochondrial carrier protein, putative n=1 Tax=Trypanosoma brucei brucei (strain 927/4 GUTat10.1) TaxID=185431 RepID=Q38DS0_TRYB2|nr:mitochondrial carrier protein, putative [Trypanosoma brucei brucei TREU927]EAN77050.1 mitochondrial carrier protein, putative [Trypanosoma brucei brucei TREU927]